MFSVIIPLYNKAAYVEKAIRSVLAQTYGEFELIVVDDGSTDDGWNVVQELMATQNPPLGGWWGFTQQNQGVSVTRNNGVKAAKYDYIAFLDADDWWEPTYLEEMKGLIEEFPGAGIWGSSYYIVKNNRKRVAPIGVENDFERGLINYCKVYAQTLCMPLTSITTIIKKSVFESEKGFKPNLKLGEDFDLWIRVAMKYQVVLLNEPLAYYNQDVEQLQRGVIDEKIYEPQTHFIFNLDYLAEYESNNPDMKYLLDKLRLYTLLRYRLQRAFIPQVKHEIDKVDFKQQPFSALLNYKLPILLLNIWYWFKKLGSKLKKKIKL